MSHLSEQELLRLAEGMEVSGQMLHHLESCTRCSAEVAQLKTLLTHVAAMKEPPADPDLLDHMAQGINRQVQRLEWRQRAIQRSERSKRSVKWVSAVAVPLAAAVLLLLLPRHDELDSGRYSGAPRASAESTLSASQWDILWDCLTRDMPELSVLNTVAGDTDDPYDLIRTMKNDELESLLDLLDGSVHG